MIKMIDFYFDFVSPYSYLAHTRIKKIKHEKKIQFNYKPILLGGLHNLLGITAPAFISSKKKYMINDCNMISKKYNINFKFNEKFPINSLYLMRGLLVIDDKIKESYIDKIYDSYWFLNIDLSNENEINKILHSLNVDQISFFKKIKDQKIKDMLKNFTQDSFDLGIFGAPTFIVNKKIFWGQDRLSFAVEEASK